MRNGTSILQTRLVGLRVAVDVQHLYRDHKPRDRGAVFQFANGTKMAEAEIATGYATALCSFFRARGADVLTNEPMAGILTGYYSARNRAAAAWGAHLYLACHVNAGRGSYAMGEAMRGTSGVPVARHVANELDGYFPEILTGRVLELGPADRGAPCIQRFAMTGPAVLLEPLFGDNPKHQGLCSSTRLLEVGHAIGRGVASWWERRLDPADGATR